MHTEMWQNISEEAKMVEIIKDSIGRVFVIWEDGARRVNIFSQNIYPWLSKLNQ